MHGWTDGLECLYVSVLKKKKKVLLTAYLSFNFFSGVQPTLEREGNKEREKEDCYLLPYILHNIKASMSAVSS